MTILERLRAATGPDRELDADIAFATQFRPIGSIGESFALHEAKHDYTTSWIAHAIWRDQFDIPDYTASIDAALELVERMLSEREIAVYAFVGKKWRCIIGGYTSGLKLMPAPFAILSALFAALEAKERT